MKISIPLSPYQARRASCPRPEVTLKVRDRFGGFVAVRFVVDTGADFSAMPISRARIEGVPIDRSRPGAVGGLVGSTRAYLGTLQVLIAGLLHAPWPCNFLEPVEAAPATARRLPVLGRVGFLDAYDLCIDERYLVLTRRSRLPRWLRPLSAGFGVRRGPDEPL